MPLLVIARRSSSWQMRAFSRSIEPAVDQQPGVVIDDQEQPGPRRPVPFRVRHPRADQDVGDPPLVRPLSLVAAVRSRARLSARPGAARRGAAARGRSARRPGRRAGDTRSRRSAPRTGPAAPAAARRPRRTAPAWPAPSRCPSAATGRSPSTPPARQRPQPPVDGAARVPAHRPVRVRMLARGDRPHHRAPLAAGQPAFAASAITAHRCSAISCRIFSSITPAPPSRCRDVLRVTGSWEA